MLMPFQILGLWFRALFSLCLLVLGISLLATWYVNREQQVTVAVSEEPASAEDRSNVAAPTTHEERRTVYWQFGFNRETAFLLGGIGLLVWSLGGSWFLSPRLWRKRGNDEPRSDLAGSRSVLAMTDGTKLFVETFGPSNGPLFVFVHGWGLDHNEWYYAKKELGATHRLILWDLAGIGNSTGPDDRNWSLEKLAGQLQHILEWSGPKPAVLVGHSIGGMILLTYCKLYSAALGTTIKGLVLAHTTYTNPVHTTRHATIYAMLQKPLLEPLCHLMVWLSPLVRALNWLSYVNGSAHRSTEKDSFSGNETRGQLDFLTKYYCSAPPDVVARGMLGMFHYDATATLPAISIPVMVVAGSNDSTCLPEASEFMARNIPRAKLITLEKAKHCGLFEYHTQFHLAIERFIPECESLPAQEKGRSAALPVPTA